jgi:hypothetical protein
MSAELKFLAGTSCHAAQGCLMGRPAVIGTFTEQTRSARPEATRITAAAWS